MNKALIVTQTHQLECQDISQPTAGPYQALVQIKACGICSTTDREIIRGRQPFHSDYPCVLGHESIGQVVAVGSKVRSFKEGDWVTRPSTILPGTHRDGLASGWGGFAQWGLASDQVAMLQDGDASLAGDYVALRQNVIPSSHSLREMVLAISLAETSSWISHLGSLQGQTVCIAGTGIAGLSLALWSKLAGAATVIVLGRRESRLAIARQIAADETIDVTQEDVPQAVRKIVGASGVGIFLEAVGQPDQINLGLSLIRPGGTIAMYGVTAGQQYDLTLGMGPGFSSIRQLPAEEHLAYPWVLDAIKRGWIPVDQLMTHTWPLANWQQAFEEVEQGKVVKGYIQMPDK